MSVKKVVHLDVPATPFCGDLRSKKFYGRDSLATEPEHYLDSTGHCWCYHTQQPVGPDGGQVTPHSCVPSRECYRSGLHPFARE